MRGSTREIFGRAYGTFGVAAFNVFTAEQIHGVFAGASEAKRPVIVQITPAARKYMTAEMLHAMVAAAEALHTGVTVAVHLDHGTREHCLSAIESGFYNSVMIDASHESFEANIATTKDIVDHAHAKGIAVEAELGMLSGVEDVGDAESGEGKYTDPDQAAEFVARTGCDSLAIAVGTSHGAYKFSGDGSLNAEVLRKIQSALPRFPLVLHGASAVPAEEIRRINMAGGDLKSDSRGLSLPELHEAIRCGVTKINIATDMRLLWTRVCREFFQAHPAQFDPVIPGRLYMEELRNLVRRRCESLILRGSEEEVVE